MQRCSVYLGTMDIIITTQNVINDIGSKFLMELQPTDPIPPKGTLIQCLNEANARLCAVAPEMYLLLQMLFDEIRRNIWSDQRRKLYMERILRVQTWAMNGRERERE